MNGEVESLWPETLEDLAPIRTPVTLLKEQAVELGRQMKNIVVANVDSHPEGDTHITNSFYLSAPTLASYKYELFSVTYDAFNLYPARVYVKGLWFDCADETALKERMKKIFADPQTMKLIQALLSQATERSSKQR